MSRKLTKKQKEFADNWLETGNATNSALKVYNTKDKNVAANIGSENLIKPKIVAYLESQAPGAAQRIVELSQKAKNEAVKLSANKDILDRGGFGIPDKSEGNKTLIINISGESAQRYGFSTSP